MTHNNHNKSNNSKEKDKDSKRIEFIGYSFSLLSFLIFLYTLLISVQDALKQQAIYWFYTSFIAALIPNIKQLKYKDIEVQFKEEILNKIDTKIDEQTKELNKNFYSVIEAVRIMEDSFSERI